MERVRQRLIHVTTALDSADVGYAVVGGNAVASWVARCDPSATRTTKDVDILVNRIDLPAIQSVMQGLGFHFEDLRPLVLFVDPIEPSKRSGVHLVWANEKVLPSYDLPAPRVEERIRDPEGYWVIDLPALVRMKLTSFRDIDRVHIADLLRVGLIDQQTRKSLPAALVERLQIIETAVAEDE